MKRALITSGGGAKGAFTIGALKCLIQKRNIQFDIISGTSTGSFIAALIAAGDLQTLIDQYLRVEPDDILTKQNIANNILRKKPYLFDSNPLLKLIDLHITQAVFDRIMHNDSPILCITAVSLQSGIATIFSNRDLLSPPDTKYKVRKFKNRNEMVKALLASGSQAGFTPPVEIDGEQFVDGGHRDVIPSRIVIDLAPDEVYVVSNNPMVQAPSTKKYDDILSAIFRAITIFVQDVRENDFRILQDYCSSKGKDPILIEPPSDLDESNPTGLRFNPVAMAGWMNVGTSRAEEKLNSIAGPVPPVIV